MKNKNIKTLLYLGIPEQNNFNINIDNEHAMILLSKIKYDKVKFKLCNENINFLCLHLNRLGLLIQSIKVFTCHST